MIETYVPISQLKIGEQYDQIFMVVSCTQKKTHKDKKPYLAITIKDVTGEMIGNVWDFKYEDNPDIFKRGGFVRMKIEIGLYQEKIQFKNFTPPD